MPKTPVFFIATRAKNQPVELRFYTKTGEPVNFDAVKKTKTKTGIQLFTNPQKAKRK